MQLGVRVERAGSHRHAVLRGVVLAPYEHVRGVLQRRHLPDATVEVRRLFHLGRQVRRDELAEPGRGHAREDRRQLLEPAVEGVVRKRRGGLVPGEGDLVALRVADQGDHLLDQVTGGLDHRDRHAVLEGTAQVAGEGVKGASVEPRDERKSTHRPTARLRGLELLAPITEIVPRHRPSISS
jgi:hypothetical protein